MTLADGEFDGASGVVEGIRGHWVVVGVVGGSDIEEHAVGLSVSEALALGVGLAGSAAGTPVVLGAAGVEMVGSDGLDVSDDTAASAWSWGWGRGGHDGGRGSGS